jgi:predicted transcriptional regulator
MSKPKPSDVELQILGVLWDAGPLAVRDVLERMPDGKLRAYTSILSCLQVMEKKGLVTHRRQGSVYLYRAAVPQQRVLGSVVRDLLQNVFGGRPSAALQYFIAAGDCSPDEIEKLRQLVEQADSKQLAAADSPKKTAAPPQKATAEAQIDRPQAASGKSDSRQTLKRQPRKRRTE